MEECVRQGLARNIGISNFNSEQITRLLAAATIKPVNNQVSSQISNICLLNYIETKFYFIIRTTITGANFSNYISIPHKHHVIFN